MGKSCKDSAESLFLCMKDTTCMKEEGREFKSCMQDPASMDQCEEFRTAYFMCKRGQLDMRTRIRGPRGGQSAKPEKE